MLFIKPTVYHRRFTMAKAQPLVIAPESISALATAIAVALGPVLAAGSAPSAEVMSQEEFLALCAAAIKESSKKEVMAILAEYDYKNPKKVEEEHFTAIGEALTELLGDDDEDEDDDEDDETTTKTKTTTTKTTTTTMTTTTTTTMTTTMTTTTMTMTTTTMTTNQLHSTT